MKFPWKRQRRLPDAASTRVLVGEELFDQAARTAFNRLETGTIENVYRVSVVAALSAATSHLSTDPQLGTLWGRGDVTRAARLLEVWASTIAITLLRQERDQAAVGREVAVGMAILFGDPNSDDQALELRAFQMQLEAHNKQVAEGGGSYIAGTEFELLHLRCVRALGGSVDFGQIPIPINSEAEFRELNIVESKYLIGIEGLLLHFYLLSEYAVAANKVFDAGPHLLSIEHTSSLLAQALEEVRASFHRSR